MNPSERYVPPAGLSVPIVTVMDRGGRVIEDEQRAVIRFVIQDGSGADVIFASGTNGEWDRIDNPRRQLVTKIAVEECRRARAALERPVEVWAGITGRTMRDTLENLDYALDLGADAAVLAPLSINDVDDPPSFVESKVGGLFDRRGRALPVFLYDNADISAPGKESHLHTRDVKQMAALPFISGVKVTAGRAVLGNYTRAASHFKLAHEFAIYAGNAHLVFDLFAPPEGLAGALRDRWNRYLTQHALPRGIVSGPANLMPREYQRVWQACHRRDRKQIERYASILGELRGLFSFDRGGKPFSASIACLKAGLAHMGVITSAEVAPGTPAMWSAEANEFIARFDAVRERAAAELEPRWVTEPDSQQRVVHA